MTIITTIATVSHRYYLKRSKEEIIRRIDEMRHCLGIDPYTADEKKWLRQQTADKLASMAMEHHAKFPE